MNIDYLTDIIILLAAAVIAVPLFQSLGLGAIPGFLVAGTIIGPSGLGYIENYDEIAHLAELGVVLLLFAIGIEINPSRLWKIKGLVLGLGSLQIVVTGCVITIITHQFLNTSWEIALLIGTALALSSTAFVLQLLTDRKTLSSTYGKTSVAILLMQDLAVVPLLAYVALVATPEHTIAEDVFIALAEALVILVLIIVIARFVLNPLLHILVKFGSPEIFTASALLLVLGSAQVMENIGLSMAMGAFIAGLLIADSSYRHQIIAEIQPFRGLLLGLFFMTMGMSLNLSRFMESPLQLLGIVIALMSIKFLALWPLTHLFHTNKKESIAISLLLAQSGEFALVLFAIAKGLNIIDETLFQHLLIIVLLSMLATPLLEKIAYRIYSTTSRDLSFKPDDNITPEPHTQPVILVGFGRMGHRVGYIMDIMKQPYVAIDNNISIVNNERGEGKAVYYGDAQKPEILRASGAADALLVIVSIDDFKATETVVSSLHTTFPDVPVFARGHDLFSCRELKTQGAYFTVSETLEASAELARAALLHIGEKDTEVESALEKFRKDYYGRVENA